ncbi:murein L,D-transpeptidase catalytic domain family protein [Halopseudomonas salegens]|nr:murein L,D-transpeptidase catalytic domain family protein [Halopseudomonas salegens]
MPVQAEQQKELINTLALQAPDIDRTVLGKAVGAMQCAVRHGADPSARLAVIDFSLPSSEPRLWVFDIKEKSLLLHELVAHGQNTGNNYAEHFSNILGSYQSSIGLFRTQESYVGRHGYSLRMDGLEPGINDLARERAIVIHAADYVDPAWVERQGRIGRSQGCPAVRPEVADLVVDSLKDGQYMFAYYPDQQWLDESLYLNCDGPENSERLAMLQLPR